VNPNTVFAPSNAAFDRLDEDIEELFTEEGKERLRYIVGLHIISSGSINFQLLVCDEPYVMDNGETTLTRCDNSGKKFQVGGGNTEDDDAPEIDNENKISDNGVLHVVDRVILPA
jgi:uncharacterized surface protein with fasciclin (FAS1) repeats